MTDKMKPIFSLSVVGEDLSEVLAKAVRTFCDSRFGALPEEQRGPTENPSDEVYQTELRRYLHPAPKGYKAVIDRLWERRTTPDGLLCVIGSSGLTQQTKEQLALARTLGAPTPIVLFYQDAPSLNEDFLDLIEQDTREVLSHIGYSGDSAPFLRGALDRAQLSSLVEQLDSFYPQIVPIYERPLRAISLYGSRHSKKTNFTAKIYQGSLQVGDEVEVVGRGPSYLAIIDQVTTTTLEPKASAGHDAHLTLHHEPLPPEPASSFLGRTIAAPNTLRSYTRCKAMVHSLAASYHGLSPLFGPSAQIDISQGALLLSAQLHFPLGLKVWPLGTQIEATLDLSLGTQENGPALEIGSQFWILREYRQFGMGVVSELIEED